ncbi:hypothetical protein SHKM778_23980 [Streptomyces sp. KM77-8]|uniref:dUTPase-like domain-containing protein n=1 Tax=Streptomyces haneummycinicus TaxID=3074435 RepID=A0AAT9HEZ2_9ACTN
MSSLEVLIRRVDPDVPLPAYEHPGDAGADLRTTEACALAPGERAVLPTGVSVALPEGTRPSCTRDPVLPPAAASPW